MDFAVADAFLLELARIAAAETLPRFRHDDAVDDKAAGGARFDPVTAADRGAEAAMRRAIGARFPDHGVVGEEYGADRPDARCVWVMDPVDGTRAFIAGLPTWTTLIGLRVEGETRLGVIAQPWLGEIFIGGRGLGARLIDRHGARPIATRRAVAVGDAIVATTDPALFDRTQRAGWDRLATATRLARLGCDAYAMAMLAAGRIDLVVEAALRPWDVEGPRAVVEGAGGTVTDWRGGPVDASGGAVLFAGDAALAAHAQRLLG